MLRLSSLLSCFIQKYQSVRLTSRFVKTLHFNGGKYENVVGFANYKINVKIAVNNTYNVLSIFNTIHNEKIEMFEE